MGTDIQDAAELAAIREQLSHLTKTTDEIKTSLAGLNAMDIRMAEIAVRFESTRSEMTTMWKRLDGIKEWADDHEKASTETKRTLESSINILRADSVATTNAIKSEFEGVINKGKGAWWILGGVLAFSQVVTLTMAAWMFNNTNDATKMNAVQQYRIEQLELKTR